MSHIHTWVKHEHKYVLLMEDPGQTTFIAYYVCRCGKRKPALYTNGERSITFVKEQ